METTNLEQEIMSFIQEAYDKVNLFTYVIDAKNNMREARAFFRIKENFETKHENKRTNMGEWCVLKVRYGSVDVEHRMLIHRSELAELASRFVEQKSTALDRVQPVWIFEVLGHCKYQKK